MFFVVKTGRNFENSSETKTVIHASHTYNIVIILDLVINYLDYLCDI